MSLGVVVAPTCIYARGSCPRGSCPRSCVSLQRKILVLGPPITLEPQRENFVMGIPTCWYLKTLKFALPPTQNLNASQWNITSGIGHVHFFLFCFDFIWVVSRFSVEYWLISMVMDVSLVG